MYVRSHAWMVEVEHGHLHLSICGVYRFAVLRFLVGTIRNARPDLLSEVEFEELGGRLCSIPADPKANVLLLRRLALEKGFAFGSIGNAEIQWELEMNVEARPPKRDIPPGNTSSCLYVQAL